MEGGSISFSQLDFRLRRSEKKIKEVNKLCALATRQNNVIKMNLSKSLRKIQVNR